MFGWKSKKMKKLESIESKLDTLISDLSRIDSESSECQNNNFNKITSQIEDLATDIEDIRSKSVQISSDITEKIENAEKSVASLLSENGASLSKASEDILCQLSQMIEKQNEAIEIQKRCFSEFDRVLDEITKSGKAADENFSRLEKMMSDMKNASEQTVHYMSSSEQLLRMIALTNVMNEIPE